MPTTDQVMQALGTVNDPEIGQPITDLGMVDGVDVASGKGCARDGLAGGRQTTLAVLLAREWPRSQSCGGRKTSKARLRLRTTREARRTRGVAALRRRAQWRRVYGARPDAITTIGRKKAFLRYCK